MALPITAAVAWVHNRNFADFGVDGLNLRVLGVDIVESKAEVDSSY
jgi:hypothetical protein